MWFLWGLIAFLVGMFSTSQIVCYLYCIFKYPKMMVDMSGENKKMVIGGVSLHFCINIIWFVLVCAVPAIRASWVVILIVTIFCLIVSFLNVGKDPNVVANFAKVTGYMEKENEEKEADSIIQNKDFASMENEEKDNDLELKEKILSDIKDWEPSFEEGMHALQDVKDHSVDRLNYYVQMAKKDSIFYKDIAKILFLMYQNDTKVFVIIDNAIICSEYLGDKYIIVYTESKYVPKEYQNKKHDIGTRDAFTLFYGLYENGMCKGIVFNPSTETQVLFTKNGLDGLHLDILFDVPWKK